MKRTAIARGSGLARRTPLAAVSPKRANQNRQYRLLRAVFLTERPWCEMGCGRRASDVHHRAGRVGALLLDTTRWSALCRPCHTHATEHPAWAIEHGISESRLGGAA